MSDEMVALRNVSKAYRSGKHTLQALQEINLDIRPGETLGIVGESGCGKSTLGKVILKLEEPTSGTIAFQGKELSNLSKSQLLDIRRKMQMIFQDPYASLNPRMTVEQIVGEGIDIHKLATGSERHDRIASLLIDVGLELSMMRRYPHEFSGGQRQRIGIARAMAVDPRFIVCDEPLSALDMHTQRKVMELLMKLKHEKKLTYLFISHDLHAVKALADTVAVMYCGRVVEYAPAKQLFSAPTHPYTQALLAAAPVADPVIERKRPRLIILGEPPSLMHPPTGCPFHPRCPKVMDVCKQRVPVLQAGVACHLLSN